MKNFGKKLLAIALVSVLVFSAFGAASSAATVRKGFDSKKVGGKVVLSTFSDAVTMVPLRASDSASIDIQEMVFDSLVGSDFNGQPIPELAESWTYDDKNLLYTFYLRKGVKWHDGKPFTAKDVKFSFDMYTDPDTFNYYKTDYEGIDSVTIVNDYTVRFKLKSRNVFFLTQPANDGWIFPAHHFPKGLADYNADNTKFSRFPIGTGPFKFKEWKADERVVLTANKEWWNGRPYMDEVIWRILPDQNVEAINLLKGDVDFVSSIIQRTVAQVEKSKNVKTVLYDQGRFDYIGFNNENPLFSDKRVRQALNYAVDKQAIVSKLFLGKAYIGTGPMHPKIPQQNPTVKAYPLDLKKAAQLLADAGWKKGSDGILAKDGKKLAFEVTYNVGNVIRPKIAQIAAQNLKSLGIDAQVRGYEWSLYLDKLYKGTLDSFVLGWTGFDGNVEHSGFFHSKSIPDAEGNGGNNTLHVDIPKADELMDKYIAEPDASKRIKLYQEMHALLQDEAVAIFTHHPKITAGMDKNLLGVKIPMSSEYWNIHDWYWK